MKLHVFYRRVVSCKVISFRSYSPFHLTFIVLEVSPEVILWHIRFALLNATKGTVGQHNMYLSKQGYMFRL